MADQREQVSGQTRRLIPVNQFNNYHPDPSASALRWLIFTNKKDFKRCVVRRGHRLLIDEQEYFRWLDEINQETNKQ